jgi:hypothetical protein
VESTGSDADRGSLRTRLSLLAHRRAVHWAQRDHAPQDARTAESALHAVPDASPGPDETVVDRERGLRLGGAGGRAARPASPNRPRGQRC